MFHPVTKRVLFISPNPAKTLSWVQQNVREGLSSPHGLPQGAGRLDLELRWLCGFCASSFLQTTGQKSKPPPSPGVLKSQPSFQRLCCRHTSDDPAVALVEPPLHMESINAWFCSLHSFSLHFVLFYCVGFFWGGAFLFCFILVQVSACLYFIFSIF